MSSSSDQQIVSSEATVAWYKYRSASTRMFFLFGHKTSNTFIAILLKVSTFFGYLPAVTPDVLVYSSAYKAF